MGRVGAEEEGCGREERRGIDCGAGEEQGIVGEEDLL